MPDPEVLKPKFWQDRIREARKNGSPDPIRAAVYQPPDKEAWERVQEADARYLAELLKPGDRILDVGCGWGSLCGIVPKNCFYLGIDVVPEFVEYASTKVKSGHYSFAVVDISDPKSLDIFPDRSFDLAVCRFIEGTIGGAMEPESWLSLLRELLRVAGRVVFLRSPDEEPRLLTDISEYAGNGLPLRKEGR